MDLVLGLPGRPTRSIIEFNQLAVKIVKLDVCLHVIVLLFIDMTFSVTLVMVMNMTINVAMIIVMTMP